MIAVFADTSFYLALLSADDEYHDRAVQLSMEMRRPVVLTEFVLLETGNSLSSVHSGGYSWISRLTCGPTRRSESSPRLRICFN